MDSEEKEMRKVQRAKLQDVIQNILHFICNSIYQYCCEFNCHIYPHCKYYVNWMSFDWEEDNGSMDIDGSADGFANILK